MAFSPPPAAPQRGDRTTFSGRVDAFLLWLVALIPQLNTFLATLTTLTGGGANTFAYALDLSTAAADPGSGRLRFNSTDQSHADIIRVNVSAAGPGDTSGFFSAMQAGTSNIKGSLRLQRLADPSAYVIYDVTSATAATGYFNLAVIGRASSATNPFAVNDTLIAYFTAKGDRGDSGSLPTDAQIRAALGTLPISSGGTGSTTAANARAALGVPAAADVVLRNATNTSVGTRLASGQPPNIAALTASAPAADQTALAVSNDGNTFASAVIQFRREGQFAAYFGLDSDNVFKVGGYSMGAVAYPIFHAGNFNPSQYAQLTGATFTGAVSAPTVTQTSDERKKTNWRALTDAQLDALAALDKVGVFDWTDGSGPSVGGSAQQIRAIVPEAVHEDADGNLSVQYMGLVFAMAHGALQRQQRAARAKGPW